jgi:glycosyltransferase involved in cell wall biosynthesis
MDSHKHIVLFANTDWYLFNFRLGLARHLANQGYRVSLISERGDYVPLLQKEFEWHEVCMGGGTKRLLKNAQAVQAVWKLYRQLRPDLVHHFTIKCVLYGGMAARLQGIPAVHSVTGLGHLFTDEGVSARLARMLVLPQYRYVFGGKRYRVIFQNEENQQFFFDKGLVDKSAAVLIRGSGADCERFRPSAAPRRPGPIRVLFASRLLREKGIVELLEAHRQLVNEGLQVELVVAGDLYPGNPSSLTAAELEDLKRQCRYVGHCDEMESLFRDADIVALPSYAEGTPRVLLEAGACGKPLIATDIAGCRGVVCDGENGILVPVRDVIALAEAIRTLASDQPLRERYGVTSRKIVESEFSENSVVHRTIGVYEQLLG